MFTAIKINDTNYKFKTGDIETEINGLNKINIFVGQNNSGKSRFMRSIFSKDMLLKTEESENLKAFLVDIGQEISNWINSMGFGGKFTYGNELGEMGKLDFFDEKNTIFNTIKNITKKIDIGKNNKNPNDNINGWTFTRINDFIYENFYTKKVTQYNLNLENINIGKFKKMYIPMLRGLKNPVKDSKDDLYKLRINGDHFSEIGNPDFEIFTGLSLYEDIKTMLLGTHKQRENIKSFENFLSKNFFEGKSITLTPHLNYDVLLVKIGNNEDIPIYDLGDGIQNIIINIFPLFKHKDENLLLFIEEPEMGIHPGMQRILLNTFAKKNGKGEHQIYFTTHSNHFLDIALDKEIDDSVSVYQFQETEDEKEKHIKNITQNKEILDLLGARNSSVFLSNCVIWAEGVSDRVYIKKFLELYQEKKGKKFEEDKHYSILEYGGGNIAHFNFDNENPDPNQITIDAISKNNFLIADNDGEKVVEGKKERLKKLKEIFGKDIFFEMPEIENLLTFEIYKAYFDKLSENGNRKWKKKTSFDNIAFNKDISKKDIGEIMRNVFIEYKTKRGLNFEKFEKKNDILIICNSKKEFAEDITKNYLNSFDDLSKESKKLTEKLYGFIESNN